MLCSLCGLAIPKHAIVEKETAFCCYGCHAVFQILSAKNKLTDHTNEPIYKQAIAAGLISNPYLIEELKEKETKSAGQPLEKLYLEIGDMWCPSCAELIRIILLQEKGVSNCCVDYSTDLASIEYDPIIISKERIKSRINTLGYVSNTLDALEKKDASYALYFRFVVAAFCSLNVMMFSYPLYATYFDFDEQGYGSLFAWLSFFASLPVVSFCSWPIFRRAWSAACVKIYGMEALVSIGVLSSFIFSVTELLSGGTQVYFDSMTVIIVFVLLGKIIESKAKFSAKMTLVRLNKSLPKKGKKRGADGIWGYVPIKEIIPGDAIQVLMGEKIVLDGIVIKGQGTCDESLMTGESLPVIKELGSRVMAGSILQNGYLEVQVVATKEETTLHCILQMIESDIHNKTSFERAVDPFVKAFVPIILLFAFFVFMVCLPLGYEIAMLRAMAVLLISCPCAIGVAAPLAESHLMHALTNLGAIIRNRGVIQSLGRETAYAFDKTGTITKGVFQVHSDLSILCETDQKILKAMTIHSFHPIARAIANVLTCEPVELSAFEEIVGKGIKAVFSGKTYFLGSRLFMQLQEVGLNSLDCNGTAVFFACEQTTLAPIYLGDEIRADSNNAVQSLSSLRTILLSGDANSAVKMVADRCSFKEWFAEKSPLEKREIIEQLKREGEIVCMVGDGINDAPALTAAHIGVSVLSASDISIQISDILLTTDRLTVLSEIRTLAQKAHRIIRQNVFWAFAYNFVGIFLAAFGLLSPIFAAGAMVASSLFVLFNAQRLSSKKITALIDPSMRSNQKT